MDAENKDDLQTILHLEECIQTGKPPNNTGELVNSRSCRIRKLARRIELGREEISGSAVDDPDCSIRALLIRNCRDIDTIKKHIADRNPAVKISILETLAVMDLDEEAANTLLPLLQPYISDSVTEVRLLFVGLLKQFTQIGQAQKADMFDKGKTGIFIYGAEDETVEVRLALVESLAEMISEDISVLTFNFLGNMLNDDSLTVRVLSMRLLAVIAKKYEITKDPADLFWLLACLKEKPYGNRDGEQTAILRKYLFRALTNIKYTDISIIRDLFGMLEDIELLRIVKKIVRKNISLFTDSLSNAPFLFSSAHQRVDYTAEYLCDLLVMSVCKDRDTLAEDMRRDVEMVARLIAVPKRIVGDELVEILHLLTQHRHEPRHSDMQAAVRKIRTVTAVGKFLKDWITQCAVEDCSPTRARARLLSVFYKFKLDMGKCSCEGYSTVGQLIDLARKITRLFIRHPKCTGVEVYTFSVQVKEKRLLPDLPTELAVTVSQIRSGVNFVVETVHDRLVVECEKSMKIHMYKADEAVCYLGVEIEGEMVRLTNLIEIR